MTINHDLLKGLTTWARQRKILPREFECPNYAKCNGSRGSRPPLDRGNTCLMSYVGREYGEPVSGKAFRLAIVGLDHGKTENVGGFTERQRGIEDYYYSRQKKFNPHYAGVIRTAAAVLGQRGKHCLKNCWRNGHCAGDGRPNRERCILRSFAQPNLVKCVSAPDMTSMATAIMYGHCSKHLVHELDVLRPNLVVFHGAPARWAFPNAVEKEGRKRPEPVKGAPPRISWVVGDGFQYYALFLNHPARGGLQRQWETVVEGALKWLRSKGAIPT
jgi:hypothetical protein